MESSLQFVMAGLIPAIHAFTLAPKQDVDHRDKPGDDNCKRWRSYPIQFSYSHAPSPLLL